LLAVKPPPPPQCPRIQSCSLAPSRRQSQYAPFICLRRLGPKFRPRVYRDIEDTTPGTLRQHTWTPVPFIPSMLLFPSQRRPLYFRGCRIQTRLYVVDGRYASFPAACACWSLYKRRLFIGEASGGAYYNITLLRVLLVTSFREHDGQ
jgi:hypothetical protein